MPTSFHELICSEPAIAYLDERHPKCANILRAIKPTESTELLIGSSKEKGACRVQFGEAVNAVLDKTSKEDNQGKVMVIDSDLEGSTGLSVIHKSHPEYVLPLSFRRDTDQQGVRLEWYHGARKLFCCCRFRSLQG
jgi:hypothetical protein